MAIIEIGNVYYLIYITIAIGLTILATLLLRNRSQRFRFWFIFAIIMVNFAIHFLKLLIFPYNDPYYVENVWMKASLENICAVSVVLFPFLYFTKSKVIKDYMVMVGIASGILAIAYPVDAIGETFNAVPILFVRGAFDLETIRFYTTHFLIFLAPFLMLRYKLHTLSIKRIVYAPMMLIAVMFILYFNEIALSLLGWVPSGDMMMDPAGRNPSLIFGIKDLQSLSGIGNLLKALVPEFLTVHPVTGETFYWPVVWMIGPVFVYGSMIAFIFALIYDKENTLAFVYDKLQNSREPLSEVTDINSHND